MTLSIDPYKILNVTRRATYQEIRRAFRELAKEHHPDVGGDEEKFKQIVYAYTVLTNPELRMRYEASGTMPDEATIITFLKDPKVQILILALLAGPQYALLRAFFIAFFMGLRNGK